MQGPRIPHISCCPLCLRSAHEPTIELSMMNKIIITCAITGAIHTPSMSPHLPITPDQIVEEAIAASEAGAAILHPHARDPETGTPDQTPQGFRKLLHRVNQRRSADSNLPTGSSL